MGVCDAHYDHINLAGNCDVDDPISRQPSAPIANATPSEELAEKENRKRLLKLRERIRTLKKRQER
tara:strand:- start:2584 stop:2781 length:198 start_codon:yes stop_codon:yes gene_type:complete